VFFMRAGFKRTPVKGSVFGRAMRASVGRLGLFIGVITAASWALFGFGSSGDDENEITSVEERVAAYSTAEALEAYASLLRDAPEDDASLARLVAFEPYGGYIADFATGLLGFAQVYWDANRQGIHDRIVGTVGIREGAAKVEDWESAL
ncbi:MAG: hypothetical protein VX815_03130, partial [Gemmatimonadota bacterium]|nr:hypothetical protein [Gemmatimonadota bacterium]